MKACGTPLGLAAAGGRRGGELERAADAVIVPLFMWAGLGDQERVARPYAARAIGAALALPAR
jgi:hypothetical protein